MNIDKAKMFIYHNARPLDLARWRYHFENGSKEAVIDCLMTYQNPDGGFGHALEADCFNPESSPVQTWAATEILREIKLEAADHPIIQNILYYLASGRDFSDKHDQWLNVIPTNNEYPHAVWWHYKEQGNDFFYNPTACLLGFIIKYADIDSELYKHACRAAKEAYSFFTNNFPLQDMHVTCCCIRLYEYCMEAEKTDLFDMTEYKNKLSEQINYNICTDIDKWNKEYVALPSSFIRSKNSIGYEQNIELIQKELRFISACQLPDGSFPITWKWCNDYAEFEIAANWWKSDFIIKNRLFEQEFKDTEVLPYI